MLVLVLIVVTFILLIADRFRPKRYTELHNQLKSDCSFLPIIGNALHFFGNNEDVFNALRNETTKSYKRKNAIVSYWLGYKFIIGVGDPILALTVLKSALNKTFIHRIGSHLVGNGTILSPADIWHRRRKVLSPTFAPRHVIKFITIFEKNAKLLAEQLNTKVGKGNVSVWDYMSHYGLDSVCETIFDVNIGALKQLGLPVCEAFKEYLKIMVDRLFKPWLYPDTLYKLFPAYRSQNRAKKIIHKFVDEIIYNKRSSKTDISSYNISNKTTNFKTLLELLMESSEETDKGYTNEELREEMLSLIIAGTETSATGLSFILMLLSQHQDIQEKVCQEIQEVLGYEEMPLMYEDLQKLKYMDAMISETLRLYPPIPLLMRDSKEDFVLSSDVTVPKNCDVLVNIFGIHQNPNYWGPDVSEFKPERFLSENTQTSHAFAPFGHSPRRCPGSLYAILSIKTTLTILLRRYRFLPATSFKYDKDNPLRLSFETTLKHVNNFDLQIERRNKNNSQI